MTDPALERSANGWSARYGIHHLAIIPDGNLRWAQQRAVPIDAGHARGLDILDSLLDRLCSAGVHTMTVWGVSSDRGALAGRDADHLLRIDAEFLRDRLLETANKHDARVCHLGRRERLSADVRAALEDVERATVDHAAHVYNIALAYGGRDELVRAGQHFVDQRSAVCPGPNASIVDYLDTVGQRYPQPDVVIRTAGERRLSGFLPVQLEYSELFFLDQPFPELTFDALADIAEQFTARKRRFGA
jgi:undecaprenyl diphosphate synthase